MASSFQCKPRLAHKYALFKRAYAVTNLTHLRLRIVCLIPDTTPPRLIGALTARLFAFKLRRRSDSSPRNRGKGRVSEPSLGGSCPRACRSSNTVETGKKQRKLSLIIGVHQLEKQETFFGLGAKKDIQWIMGLK